MNLRTSPGCLFLLLFFSGCAQLPGVLSGNSGSLPIDPTDPCGKQRQSFAQSQNYFTQSILTKASGNVVSAAASSLTSGNFSGALKRVVNAGVAGAKSGYWDALNQQKTDKRELTQTINSDLHQESLAIDHTTATFAVLRTCRLAQAKRIKDLAQFNRVDRTEARRQLKQEQDWFNTEIAVARDAGVNMQQRDDQFAYAAQNLREQNPGTQAAPGRNHSNETERREEVVAPTRSSRSGSDAAITTSATETLPQKRNSFESSVKRAEAESATAFSLDNSARAKERRYA